MTREEFEIAALRRLQLLYPRARFLKAGQLEIAILRTPSGRPTAHRLRLSRAWAAFCQNGERFDLDGYLTRVVGTVEHRLPPDWDSARRLVFPKLLMRDVQRRLNGTPLYYFLAGEMGYVLSCDEYDVALNADHLRLWGVPEECVLASAQDNLVRLWDSASIVAWTVQDNIRAFHVEVNHGHKAAFVLLPEFYQRAVEVLNATEIMVAIPNRNFLVAFSAGDTDFHQTLQPILRKELAAGYALSRVLLRLDESGYCLDAKPIA